jgi:hypothetical protein
VWKLFVCTHTHTFYPPPAHLLPTFCPPSAHLLPTPAISLVLLRRPFCLACGAPRACPSCVPLAPVSARPWSPPSCDALMAACPVGRACHACHAYRAGHAVRACHVGRALADSTDAASADHWYHHLSLSPSPSPPLPLPPLSLAASGWPLSLCHVLAASPRPAAGAAAFPGACVPPPGGRAAKTPPRLSPPGTKPRGRHAGPPAWTQTDRFRVQLSDFRESGCK